MCLEGSQARPRGTVPQGCGPRVRGTCAARLVHPRSESGLQHWSSPCWELPTPLATRLRQRAQQEVGLPWFLPDTSHPSSHILSLIPGLGSWPTPQGVVSPPRRKLWAFLVLVPTQCPAEPAAGVRCSPASGAPKSRLAMGRCLGGFAGSDQGSKPAVIHSTRMTWFTSIADSTDMSLSKPRDGEGQGSLAGCSLWGHN